MVTLDTGFVDDALLERAQSGAAGWSTAEILRARAERLLAAESPCHHTVESALQQSLVIAKTQGALAWELRSATSLAQLWQRQSRYREALELLTPVYQRFTEGYATPDLRKVRLLLDELRSQLRA
jgi:predicted ATPase